MPDPVHTFVLRLESGLDFIVAAPLRDMNRGAVRFNRPPSPDEMEQIRPRMLAWRADSMQTVADITGETVEDEILQPDGSFRFVTYAPRPA